MGGGCSTDNGNNYTEWQGHQLTKDYYDFKETKGRYTEAQVPKQWIPVGKGAHGWSSGFLGMKKHCDKTFEILNLYPYELKLENGSLEPITFRYWKPNRQIAIPAARFDVPTEDACDSTKLNCGIPEAKDPRNPNDNTKFMSRYYDSYSNTLDDSDPKSPRYEVVPELSKTASVRYMDPNTKFWNQKGTDRKTWQCEELTVSKHPGSKTESKVKAPTNKLLNSAIPLPFDPNNNKAPITVKDSTMRYRDPNFYVPTAQYKVNSGLLKGVYLPAGIARDDVDKTYTHGIDDMSKSIATITPFTLSDDIFMFTDNVMSHWLDMLLSDDNLTLIIKDARDIILENPQIVMLHAVWDYCNRYKEKDTASASYVELPLGPPMVSVNSSVIPKKYYMPSVEIEKIDSKMPTYNTTSATPVITSIHPKIKDGLVDNPQYYATNFLDETFTELVDNCKLRGVLENSTDAVVATVPSKGFQIFEVIMSNMVGGSSVISADDIDVGIPIMSTNYTNLVYPTTQSSVETADQALLEAKNRIERRYKTYSDSTLTGTGDNRLLPRLVMSFDPLKGGIDAMYQDLEKSTNASRMIIKHNNEAVGQKTIDFEINTLSTSSENVVHFYIPKTDVASANYNAGSSNGNSSTNINGIPVKMIVLDYNATDEYNIPALLMVNDGE